MEDRNYEESNPIPEEDEETFQMPKLPGFLSRIGQDVRWYYDVRLWLPLILILLLLAMCSGPQESPVPQETEPPATVQTEPEILETVMAPINPEAQALAILADSVGAGRSNNVKTVIMWVAINRSEDKFNGHGLTLMEEIARPNQWQGYDENAEYTRESYEIAMEVLDTVSTGGLRPLDNDMLWLILNDDGTVTVRNKYIATNDQSFHKKTFK